MGDAGLKPHAFRGREDHGCEACGLADWAPVHRLHEAITDPRLDRERSPADRIKRTLEAVIYQVPGWSGPDPWFKPDVEDALEALAVLRRQRNEQVSELLDLERQLDIKARQLAEKDEALRRIDGEVTKPHGVITIDWYAQATYSAREIAREALRAEPAKDPA